MMRVGGQHGALADTLGDGQAVGAGHPGVQQHQRERPARGHRRPQRVQGLETVGDRQRLRVPAPQPLLEDLAVGRVVVDDEDAQAVQVDQRPLVGAARRVGLQAEFGREAERAAPARLALDA